MKRSNFIMIGLLCATIFLGSCQESPPSISIEVNPTHTSQVEQTPTSTITAAPTASHTPEILPTAVETVSPGLAFSSSMVFLGETIPDGTSFRPGESFTKSWTLKNGGTVPWSGNYQLVRTGSLPEGEWLNSPQSIALAKPVLPGESIQISVDLKAPQQEGQYTVYYQLTNDKGEEMPATTIWVSIVVCSTGTACNAGISGGSMDVNGITVSLSEFTYTEDTTTIIFCMDLPNRNYALDLAPVLMIDQKPAPFIEGLSDNPWNCMRLFYQVGAAQIQQAEEIILEINSSLRMSPPKGDPNVACETARQSLIAQYPGLDFHCNFSMAGYYTNLKLPSGLKREDAQQIIFDAIEGAIYGPWVLDLKAMVPNSPQNQ